MTQTEYEELQIKYYFDIGQLSKEKADKLLDDITPMLWNELPPVRGNIYVVKKYKSATYMLPK